MSGGKCQCRGSDRRLRSCAYYPLFQAKEKRGGTGILILPNDCLNLPSCVDIVAGPAHFAVILKVGDGDFVTKNTHNGAALAADRAHELKLELASRVARLI